MTISVATTFPFGCHFLESFIEIGWSGCSTFTPISIKDELTDYIFTFIYLLPCIAYMYVQGPPYTRMGHLGTKMAPFIKPGHPSRTPLWTRQIVQIPCIKHIINKIQTNKRHVFDDHWMYLAYITCSISYIAIHIICCIIIIRISEENGRNIYMWVNAWCFHYYCQNVYVCHRFQILTSRTCFRDRWKIHRLHSALVANKTSIYNH